MQQQKRLSDAAAALAEELTGQLDGEVRFDDGHRALYATDASNYRQAPIGVVIPRHAEDVMRTVAACRRRGVPVLSRGCGTSLAGQCCNVAVVIDMSKYMTDILEINPEERFARVQPGVILDHLRAAAEEHGLTFAPDPATHTHNTIGGMIGNNSCGIHSVMGGRTVDNVIELDVLTYDGSRLTLGETPEAELQQIVAEGGRRGEIYRQLRALRDRHAEEIRKRFPKIPRRVSGYSIDELLPENGFHVARAVVGSEGTCVAVLKAKVRLVPSPPKRALLLLAYPDVYQAGDHVPAVLSFGPVGLEGIDRGLIQDMEIKRLHTKEIDLLPTGNGWLLVEFGGDTVEQAKAKASRCADALKQSETPPNVKLYDDPEQMKRVWEIRESGLASTAHIPTKRDTWPGWEDSAVPPERVGDYLRELRKLFERYGYECDLYGHFGQGCIHTRIDFELDTADGVRNFRSFLQDASDLVVRFGGSFSGEHGDGQARGELLPKLFGEQLTQAFRDFKSIWDPEWKMNPGKVIDADPVDQNLRLGTHYTPMISDTYFKYPEDQGDFGKAALRCVGVGKCRRWNGGTMCPSFMALHEEMHTTRGRARMLFEMLRGDVITEGWQEESVKEALHLCLACKGCKNDCPVNVDMATYKAEFLAHYYKQHRRPIRAYGFGLINEWSRLAAKAPSLANLLLQKPPFSQLVKAVGNIAPQRRLPAYAPQTFTRWFRSRTPHSSDQREVMLWPDTFNEHFYPEILQSATGVLGAAGFTVRVPAKPICCGRPLYDFGMLDRARARLARIMAELTEVNQGLAVVVLEPSCAAVFRDELMNLFPDNPQAKRLSEQTFTLDEFLLAKTDYQVPRVQGRALLHGHCNHKAVLNFLEPELLRKLGLDVTVLDSGCCGMAGAFGYERDKYDVSIKCGERVLAPAVRDAPDDTLIVAGGFSCREQIAHLTGRRALHVAEVLAMAANGGQRLP